MISKDKKKGEYARLIRTGALQTIASYSATTQSTDSPLQTSISGQHGGSV